MEKEILDTLNSILECMKTIKDVLIETRSETKTNLNNINNELKEHNQTLKIISNGFKKF